VTAYIIRRLLQGLFVILIITILVFFAIRYLPGDPLLTYVSGSQFQALNPEQIKSLRQEFGLDKPVIVQYGIWVLDLFRGDLGTSIFYREPVSKLLATRLPITLHVGLTAFILSSILGIAAGTVSALRRGKWMDTVITFIANIGICVPAFWLAILLIYLFSYRLGLLPIGGYTSPFSSFWLSTRQLILPVLCLSIFGLAGGARQSRSSVLEVISQDYVRTAWSKGLSERAVTMRHILKNSLIAVVVFQGMGFAYILGGSVFIESVFGINGIGRLAASSVNKQDYAVIQAIVLLTSVMVTLTNLVVDISLAWLDPRIRY
jgi:peptide/nickel transport system permease protein